MPAMRSTLLSAVLAALCAVDSSAQMASQAPLRVRVGQWQARSAAKSLDSAHIGVSVDLPGWATPDGSQWTLGFFRGDNGSQQMETIPVLLTKSSEGSSLLPGLPGAYSATGFGAYRVSVTGVGDKVLFGGFIGAGMRIGDSLFAELQYHSVSGSVNGFSPNGVTMMLGKRF